MRLGRPTARASGARVSHGVARCPAAAGSPLRAQLVLMTSVQLRTGESSTSAAISPWCRGWSASWRAIAAPIDQPKITIRWAPRRTAYPMASSTSGGLGVAECCSTGADK